MMGAPVLQQLHTVQHQITQALFLVRQSREAIAIIANDTNVNAQALTRLFVAKRTFFAGQTLVKKNQKPCLVFWLPPFE